MKCHSVHCRPYERDVRVATCGCQAARSSSGGQRQAHGRGGRWTPRGPSLHFPVSSLSLRDEAVDLDTEVNADRLTGRDAPSGATPAACGHVLGALPTPLPFSTPASLPALHPLASPQQDLWSRPRGGEHQGLHLEADLPNSPTHTFSLAHVAI